MSLPQKQETVLVLNEEIEFQEFIRAFVHQYCEKEIILLKKYWRKEFREIEIPDDFENVSIPDEEYNKIISGYNIKIEIAGKWLKEVENWSDEQAESESQESYNYKVLLYNNFIENKQKNEINRIKLLEQAVRWDSPTIDHQDLKDSMIWMLKACKESIYFSTQPPQKLSGKEFKMNLIEKLQKYLSMWLKIRNSERRRAYKKSEWLRKLFNR